MERVLNSSNRARLYSFFSISLFAGALLNLGAMHVLYGNELKRALTFSLILFAAGILVKVALKLRISDSAKDCFVFALVLLMIPFITFQFIESGSVLVLAFPFLFIIMFTVFGSRMMLLALSGVILATQLSAWFLAPASAVQADSSDRLALICMYMAAVWLAYYVNRLYESRLKENSDQASLHKSVAAISTDFIGINQLTVGKTVSRMLESLGTILGADRSYIFLFDRRKNTASCKYLWSSDGAAEVKHLENLPFFMYPWWGEQMRKNGLVSISDTAALPAEAEMEKTLFAKHKVKSILTVPLYNEDQQRGFIGISSSEKPKNWREDHVSMLRVMSSLAAEAFTKVESEGKHTYLAFYDQLTSLANRTLFNDRLSQAINMSKISGNVFGVMFLDLDSFKMINDTMGHENGDELLKMVSNNLSRAVRNTDTVARFGGDEFLVLINNVADRGDIITVADKVMSVFKNPFKIDGKELIVTASAGIAVFPMDGTSVHNLIKNADNAMYHAKDGGKNQYRMCASGMNSEIQNEVEIAGSLDRALERNELHLFYQPEVDAISGKIIGVEALLRWTHPKFGNISPSVFIPLAEKTGSISPIGEWVLWTACKQNKTWQEKGYRNIRIGVNLSLVQFRSAELIDRISEILKNTGLCPEYLDLEITESDAIRNLEQILEPMKKLRELGVHISIDDFGAEQSSFRRLKELPIDHLKMDRQFVHGIDGSVKEQELADSLINLSKNLGFRLVAEGVETSSQLQFLVRKGCDEIQGYYFYRPMPPSEIESLFRKELEE
jgi:diguanylate cyclase (GGDEF)-like protein